MSSRPMSCTGLPRMQLLLLNGAALAIALLYATWRFLRHHDQQHRQRVIRERVALLLWTAAQNAG